jgi:type II secretory pathway pseudopilin PulG
VSSVRDGFSLVEALIGLAITAGVAIAALGMLAADRQSRFREVEVLTAAVLAEERAAEIVMELRAGPGEAPAQFEGTFHSPLSRFRWHAAVRESAVAGAVDLAVTVRSPAAEFTYVNRIASAQ